LFEKRLLRRAGLFGPERDEETGGWRKILYDELYNILFTTSEIKED
jgi:hypothetical protein